jgi:uncharacterized membrane protein (Fun14 family)
MADPRDRPLPPTEVEPPRPMARWKKVLVGVATLLIVAGVVLAIVERGSPPAPPPGPGELGPAGTGWQPLNTGGRADPAAGDTWGPAFLKMGFSFFVGFALGYALRTFLRVTLVVAGVVFLILFALQYFQYVVIDWQKMSVDFDQLMARARSSASSVKAFVTGSLPAAGLGGAGLLAGFRR